jgi:hypothetical protein
MSCPFAVMSFLNLILLALAAALPTTAGTLLEARQNPVDIVQLNKNVSGTSGSGDVSAAGNLSPFGKLGVGCGINWTQNASFGGKMKPPFSHQLRVPDCEVYRWPASRVRYLRSWRGIHDPGQ